MACDGVGTKLRIASSLENYQSIGIDLVAMCVNDLIVSGAKPIAFLDYYGVSKLDRQIGRASNFRNIKGCQLSGCDLIGGETAEMPNHYTNGNFDLVGFAMGINERNKIIDGSGVKDGIAFWQFLPSVSFKWIFLFSTRSLKAIKLTKLIFCKNF